jgi:hypothetical protein
MLHAEQCAEDVGVEGGRIALGGLFRHRARLALGSGVVDRHIQATKVCDGLIDEAAHIIFMADISTPILRFSADLAKFTDQFLVGFAASAPDNDVRTLFREGNRGGPSNAREGASDQNNGRIHSEFLGGQFMGQSRLDTLNMDVRIITCQASDQTDSTQAAEQNVKKKVTD